MSQTSLRAHPLVRIGCDLFRLYGDSEKNLWWFLRLPSPIAGGSTFPSPILATFITLTTLLTLRLTLRIEVIQELLELQNKQITTVGIVCQDCPLSI